MSSSFGRLLTITTFGESHGPAVGVILDGCPPGIAVDAALVQRDLDRRRPGQSAVTTSRKEPDQVEIGSRCVLNALRHLGMMPGAVEPPAKVVRMREFVGVRSTRAGLLFTEAALGAMVRRGDRLARIESVHGDEEFRPSHFKPLRDFSRITRHVVADVLRRGGIAQVYRRIRANPALVDDPSGEFASAPLDALPTRSR